MANLTIHQYKPFKDTYHIKSGRTLVNVAHSMAEAWVYVGNASYRESHIESLKQQIIDHEEKRDTLRFLSDTHDSAIKNKKKIIGILEKTL